MTSPATIDKPSRLAADEITTWTPTMLYVGRGGTIAKKTCPASPWGNKLRVAKFGRTEAIKQWSKTLTQDPLKRALLPTLAGKKLVCHGPAHEECHADALAQACES